MRIEIIDSLKSSTEDALDIRSKAAYSIPYDLDTYTEEELLSYRAALQLLDDTIIISEIVDIPAGTEMTDGYVEIDYAPYTAHGNDPVKWIELILNETTDDPPVLIETEQQYIPIRRIFEDGAVTKLRIFAMPAEDGTTADHLQLIIK